MPVISRGFRLNSRITRYNPENAGRYRDIYRVETVGNVCVREAIFSGTAVTPCLRGTEAFLISGKYKKLVNLLDVAIATAGCNFLYYL